MSGWHVPSRASEVGWRCIPSQRSSAMLRGRQSCSTMSCRAIAPANLALSGCNSLRECDALSRVWRTRQSLKSAQSMEACLGSGPSHSVKLHLRCQATPEGRREMVGSRCCKRSKSAHQTWLQAPKHCMICRRKGGAERPPAQMLLCESRNRVVIDESCHIQQHADAHAVPKRRF